MIAGPVYPVEGARRPTRTFGYHRPSMSPRPAAHAGALFGGVVVLVAGLSMRAPIISVAPVLSKIQEHYGLGSVAASLLTSLPVLCFGALAFVAPLLGRRIGMERTIVAMLGLIVVGVLVRSLWGTAGLFLGTVLLGSGIAVNNVLLPAAIKRHWTHVVGPLMSTLSVSMALGPTLAALLTVPLYQWFDGSVRWTLAVWVVLPLAGLALFEALRGRLPATAETAHEAIAPTAGRLWRQPLAWQVSAFLGLQSLLFYAFTGWLPTILVDAGLTDIAASLGFSVFTILNIVGSFGYPIIAVKLRQQSGLAAASAGMWLVGIGGLSFAPTATAYLWAGVAGLASGASFSLALTLLVLRTRDATTAARLSGMAQAVGYLLAATGPLMMGWVFDRSGGWTAPLLVLLAVVPVMALAGVGSGRALEIGPTST